MNANRQEHPRRRFHVSQQFRPIRWNARPREAHRRPAVQSPDFHRAARENGDRYRFHDRSPVPPTVELQQIVRPHQPDEPDVRIRFLQRGDRIRRELSSVPRFKVGNDDPRIGGCDGFGAGEPAVEGGHAFLRFQRILRRNEPPHLVQPQKAQRLFGNVQMPVVGGIERSAQQTDRFDFKL